MQMSKAIDKIRSKIATERAKSLKRKKDIDAVLAFSKGDGSVDSQMLHTVNPEILNLKDSGSKYLVAENVTLYHEGAVVDEYGWDYIVGKGTIKQAIDNKLEEGIETVIVNANHERYQYNFQQGYIGDIPVESLRAEYDENGRAMLKGDIKLFKDHSVVKDMLVQNEDLSVSIEIGVLEYSYRKLDDNGTSTEDEEANTVMVLEKFTIDGLAIVAYPRIASTTNGVKLSKLKEDNMPKELKEKLEEKEIINSQEEEQVADKTETTEEAPEAPEVSETEATDEAEDALESKDEELKAEIEEAKADDTVSHDEAFEEETEDNSKESIDNIANALEKFENEKVELTNAIDKLKEDLAIENAARVKAEAQALELKNSIEELNKKFTSINSSATIVERSSNKQATASYEINTNAFDEVRGVKEENK